MSAPRESVAPEVTVVLPAFNAGRTIETAAGSILAEREVALSLMVIDDGSTDDTAERVERMDDPRIVLRRNERNLGLIATLNQAYDRIETPFLARMDADDVSLPGRFPAQLEFLRTHPDVDIVGTAKQVMRTRAEGVLRTDVRPTTHERCRWILYFQGPLVHPSILARTERLRSVGPLDPGFAHAEDYEFWVRARDRLRFANLAGVYIESNKGPECVSRRFGDVQRENATRAAVRLLEEDLGRPVPSSVAFALSFPWRAREIDPPDFVAALELVAELEALALARVEPASADANWIRADASLRIRMLAFQAARASPRTAPAMLLRWLRRDRARAPIEAASYLARAARRRI